MHTGLGPGNTLTVYSGLAWSDDAGKDALRPGKLADFVTGLPGTLAVPATGGPFVTYGDVIDFVPALAPGRGVVALTLEWGTVGDSYLAEADDQCAHDSGAPGAFPGLHQRGVCTEVKRNFVDLFNPDDAAFRGAVLSKGLAFIDRLSDRHPSFGDDDRAGR